MSVHSYILFVGGLLHSSNTGHPLSHIVIITLSIIGALCIIKTAILANRRGYIDVEHRSISSHSELNNAVYTTSQYECKDVVLKSDHGFRCLAAAESHRMFLPFH